MHRWASRLASSRSPAKAASSSVAEAVSLKSRRLPISRVADSAGSAEFGIQGRGSSVCASARRLKRRGSGKHTLAFRVRRVRGRTGRSPGSAAAAGFGSWLRRAHGAAAGFSPRPFAADWVRGIRAVHGGRTLASLPWSGGSAGGLGIDRQGARLLAPVRSVLCRTVVEGGATGFDANGKGTSRSSGVGSTQRCKARAVRHHN